MPARLRESNRRYPASPQKKAYRMKGVKTRQAPYYKARRASLIRPCPRRPNWARQSSSLPHSAAPNNGAARPAAAAVDVVPPPPCRVLAEAGTRRRGEHGHAGPPAQAMEAAQQHAARGSRSRRRTPARPRRRNGVVQHVPRQLGVRRHATDVRHGGVPLRGAGVRLPEVRPPRQAVPQVPVAPSLVRAPEVQRTRFSEEMEGEEDPVRGGLAQPEPVGVAGVHAARGRAGGKHRLHQGQPRLHHHVPGLRGVGGVLPEHVPGGHRGGVRGPGAEARLHHRRRLARSRRAHLQHLALVDAHRQGPAMGLRARRSAGGEGHGPAHGLLQGDVHMGQVGRLQRRHLQDQGLLPRHFSDPLQRSRVGRAGQELRAADAAGGGVVVSGGSGAGAERGEGGAQRHVEAGVPARHHAAVAAQAGRPPVRLQRRPPGKRLQPLVPRGRAGHVEPDPLRFASCIIKDRKKRTKGILLADSIWYKLAILHFFLVTLFHNIVFQYRFDVPPKDEVPLFVEKKNEFPRQEPRRVQSVGDNPTYGKMN